LVPINVATRARDGLFLITFLFPPEPLTVGR
jgi:hypothetical protein